MHAHHDGLAELHERPGGGYSGRLVWLGVLAALPSCGGELDHRVGGEY